MGKKSKRRGGGTSNGGRARCRAKARGGTIGGDANAGTLALVPAGGAATRKASKSEIEDAMALLENVRPLDSLKGIVSTNDDPNKCAWCGGDIIFSIGSQNRTFQMGCCGKSACKSCCEKISSNSLETRVADLLGEKRCIFCNATSQNAPATLMKRAKSGEAWAQYLVATKCILNQASMRGPIHIGDYLFFSIYQRRTEIACLLCKYFRFKFWTTTTTTTTMIPPILVLST